MMMSVKDRMKAIAEKHKALKREGKAKQIWEKLIAITDSFQAGRIASASSAFYDLFCSEMQNMRIFKIPQDTCLYRMRAGKDAYDEFTTEGEMSHIPFELNHLAGNERYSISGFPSLYLGASAYVCWEELHRPDFNYASTALFKAKRDIHVFDLTAQEYYHFTNELFSNCLVLACSLPVAYPDAPFKPEYNIPHMFLQSLVQYINEHEDNTVFGIKYSSARIKDKNIWINFPENRQNKKLFCNYVFPAFDRKQSGTSMHISSLFQFWNSTTYQKMALMRPDFKTACKEKYYETKFGLLEDYLKHMRLSGMLTYDPCTPKGRLT